jgi:GH18 family chitinase
MTENAGINSRDSFGACQAARGLLSAEAIHKQNYHVADVPAGPLRHVICAFAEVTADVSVDTNNDNLDSRNCSSSKEGIDVSISKSGRPASG